MLENVDHDGLSRLQSKCVSRLECRASWFPAQCSSQLDHSCVLEKLNITSLSVNGMKLITILYELNQAASYNWTTSSYVLHASHSLVRMWRSVTNLFLPLQPFCPHHPAPLPIPLRLLSHVPTPVISYAHSPCFSVPKGLSNTCFLIWSGFQGPFLQLPFPLTPCPFTLLSKTSNSQAFQCWWFLLPASSPLSISAIVWHTHFFIWASFPLTFHTSSAPFPWHTSSFHIIPVHAFLSVLQNTATCADSCSQVEGTSFDTLTLQYCHLGTVPFRAELPRQRVWTADLLLPLYKTK